MELYRLGLPNDNVIIARDKFIIDIIIPLSIKKINDKDYSILFFAEQTSTESSLFLQSIIAMSEEEDEGFLNNHPLNIINIQRDPERLKFYNEKIDSMHGNTFNTDFDMCQNKEEPRFFSAISTKPIYVAGAKEAQASVMDLLITRDNFIRLSLFFTKF